MGFTLQQYIDQVRNRHPVFEKRLVPDKVLADFATLDQREVLTLALGHDRQYLAQPLPIGFDLVNADADAPGTAGAGTAGGVPAQSDGQDDTLSAESDSPQSATGFGVEIQTTNVVTLLAETVVASASPTTLTAAGVSWTTNQYQYDTVIITAGAGSGQPPRTIASNTADTLTVSQPWAVIPDTTSVFLIVQGIDLIDQTFGAVTDVPGMGTRTGYLVRLNAQGIPYLDTTKPLTVSIARGVPLPPYLSILGGTVRLNRPGQQAGDPPFQMPLTLNSFSDRFQPHGTYNAYLLNGSLYLMGGRLDWDNVQGIELTYVPIPPALQARTDYFLLPDNALPVLVARAVVFAAQRVQGVPGVPQLPMDQFATMAQGATDSFIKTLSLTTTARVSRMRRGRY